MIICKDPCLYLRKLEDKARAEDPCVDTPEVDAYYQCGFSAVHQDQVPWRGQCKPPVPRSKKEL
jgi:hypothetical protein